MKQQQIISIKTNEFAFCRYAVALIAWVAVIYQVKELLALVFVILFLSAMLTVRYAPMILLWRYTLGQIIKSKEEIINVKAMRFAHSLGAILSGFALIFVYTIPIIGWGLAFLMAVMKTISAFGFCPASKLYVCMLDGNGCCALSRKKNAR